MALEACHVGMVSPKGFTVNVARRRCVADVDLENILELLKHRRYELVLNILKHCIRSDGCFAWRSV